MTTQGTTPTEVTLTMIDYMTGNKVIRSIDISNLYVSNSGVCENGWEGNMIAEESKREELLIRWIECRGNDQHNALLGLLKYELN